MNRASDSGSEGRGFESLLGHIRIAPQVHFCEPRRMRIFAAILGGWSESPLLVIDHRRDGRVVECGGLEIRCTARYRGFESLSLRNKGCKSASYAIYTLFYTRKYR